jgi:hypothetical protein
MFDPIARGTSEPVIEIGGTAKVDRYRRRIRADSSAKAVGGY